MPEPGTSPGLAEVVRRWTVRLSETPGFDLPEAELEHVLSRVAQDIAKEKAAAREAATARFAAFYSALPQGVIITDPAGHIFDVNAAMAELLGCEAHELTDRDVTELAARDEDVVAIREALGGLVAGQPLHFERVDLEHATEGPLRTRLTVTSLPGDKPGTSYPILIVQDINEASLLHEALRKQATHDPLTGLPNAGSFYHRLETALTAGADSSVALVYFDIDGFKVVNDGLSRDAGDEILCHVANQLNAVFTPHDGLVGRLIGDGFGALLSGTPTTTQVVGLIEEAMEALAEPVYVGEDRRVGVSVSLSAGIVVLPAEGLKAEDLLRAAEITLHRAKENGRAQWMLFEQDLDKQDRRRYSLGAEIGGALEHGQFEVEYAPTVKLDGSGQITVVNAVLKWNHPRHGTLRPDEFMKLADTTGMTLSLGKWLLTDALREGASWHREFPQAPDVCVRLPRRLAIDQNLVKIVREQLEESGLPPQKLRICTDSLSLLDPRGEVTESLAVLAELDVKMALAVTGSADLELLHKHGLPVGFVILSGPLVSAIGSDGQEESANALKQLGTLLQRAKELGVQRVGAEGVHTEEHRRRLQQLGIIAGRGKLFGGAATAAQIREAIREGTIAS